MSRFHHAGSGITSPWMRAFLCLVLIGWGGMIAVFSLESMPTPAQARYTLAVSEAAKKGQRSETVPKPPESQMWKMEGFPAQTILGLVIIAIGIAMLTEPLWRRRSSPADGAQT